MSGGRSAEPDVLRYFLLQRDGITGVRRRRLRDAESTLRRCLDDQAEALSTGADLALLRMEQQFGSDGAGSRLAPATVVLQAFEPYLVDDRYFAADEVDRTLRLRLVWRLGLTLIDSLGLDEAGRAERVEALQEVHLHGRRHRTRVRRQELEASMRRDLATAHPWRAEAYGRALEDLAAFERRRDERDAAAADPQESEAS